jgi:hypothetical protein
MSAREDTPLCIEGTAASTQRTPLIAKKEVSGRLGGPPGTQGKEEEE